MAQLCVTELISVQMPVCHTLAKLSNEAGDWADEDAKSDCVRLQILVGYASGLDAGWC